MLRKKTFARLASPHSPEKEQRLLSFAKDPLDPNAGKGPEGEKPEPQEPEKVDVNPVEHTRELFNALIKHDVPEIILTDLNLEIAYKLFGRSGAMSRELDVLIRKRGLEPKDEMEFPAEIKIALINELLQHATDAGWLRITQGIQGLVREKTELSNMQEQTKRMLIKQFGADPIGIDRVLYQLADLEKETMETAEIPTVTEDNIFNVLKIPEAIRAKKKEEKKLQLKKIKSLQEEGLNPVEQEEILEPQDVLELLKNVANGIRDERAFGLDSTSFNDFTALGQARTKFVLDAKETLSRVKDYLTTRLEARGKHVIEHCDELMKGLPKETSDTDVEDVRRKKLGQLKESALNTMQELDESKTANDETDTSSLALNASVIRRLEACEAALEVNPEDEQYAETPRVLAGVESTENAKLTWATQTAKRLFAVDTTDWAKLCPNVLEMLESYKDFFEAFKEGSTPTEEDMTRILTMHENDSLATEERIDMILLDPAALESTLARIQKLKPIEDSEIANVMRETREKVGTIVGDIVRFTEKNSVCKEIGVDSRMKAQEQDIMHQLSMAEILQNRVNQEEDVLNARETVNMQRQVREIVQEAQIKMAAFEECRDQLTRIQNRDPTLIREVPKQDDYKKIAKEEPAARGSLACYNYDDGLIYLNMELIMKIYGERDDKSLQGILDHEFRHAAVDAFRRSGVFPYLLVDLYADIGERTASDGTTFEQLLIRQTRPWGMPPVTNPNKPTKEEIHTLMDELVNKFTEWKTHGKPAVRDDLQQLFTMFESRDKGIIEQQELLDLSDRRGRITQEEAEAQEALEEQRRQERGETEAAPVAIGGGKYSENLLGGAEKAIQEIDMFLEAYPEYETAANKSESEQGFAYAYAKDKIIKKRELFTLGQYSAYNDDIVEKIHKDLLDPLLKAIKEIDKKRSDLTHETKVGGRSLKRRLVEDIAWVTIPDIIKLFKEAGEDLNRMWQRRGTHERTRLGKAISGLIPEDIWYFGRLKHEFERRDRESEEEEVGVWEKGLEKLDAEELQEMIPHVKTKDHLKAIIRLLTKKGRLDWDDKKLWAKLEYFSGYKMPEGPCERDTRLRNSWLQKMMADIWRDRDLYEHMRVENDGAIESGKEKLKTYVDDLSATGTLRTELQKLLTNYTRHKKHEKLAKEEEVNPHLYEKILYYAMKNGKMSMEEKFYFLVKGVAIGLLSTDRLRALSGEEAGILNTFPFIDFFSSGQNCTMHEIKQIEKQITETHDKSNTYFCRPGPKTTKYLYQVVAFDKNVSDRVQKALKRLENIDHEDIPMYITHMDYGGVTQMVNFTSGSQAKMSAPALKNGYVGYNSFFRYFGMKATIGQPPISARDVTKIITSLGGYMQWDNVITRDRIGAPESLQKPKLTWNQINNEAPVSGDKMTSQYRDKMNEFTVTLCERLNILEIDGIAIRDFVGITRSSDMTEDIMTRNHMTKREELYKKIIEGTPKFVELLSERLQSTGNQAILANLLREKQGTFIPENDEFDLPHLQNTWNSQAEAHH